MIHCTSGCKIKFLNETKHGRFFMIVGIWSTRWKGLCCSYVWYFYEWRVTNVRFIKVHLIFQAGAPKPGINTILWGGIQWQTSRSRYRKWSDCIVEGVHSIESPQYGRPPVEYMVLWVQVRIAHSLLRCGWPWVGHSLCLLWDYPCLVYL